MPDIMSLGAPLIVSMRKGREKRERRESEFGTHEEVCPLLQNLPSPLFFKEGARLTMCLYGVAFDCRML
jgi:hypothetical protein